MLLQVPVPDCSCEQGGRVLAFLRDKTSPRETQEPCTNYWQGCRRIKVNQGGERSWDVNFVWFPGEPDDSVEDQREGGTSSAVQLVEGWFDIHSFSQDLRFWDFGGTLSFIDSLHNVKIFTETFQVVRLRRTMITRWRLKNTREGQQLSCRYWRHRWDISSLELEIDKTSTRLS